MRLDEDECWERLSRSEHGVLGTLHPERGVDLVPVVFTVTAHRRLVMPIDTVKPKSTTRLQRVVNLRRDPRCALVVDNYEPDWTGLWWVRAAGTAEVVYAVPEELARFERYRQPGAVVACIVLNPTTVTGWAG
jgi:PPOX class probable F420-dependent enzyme